MATLAQKGKRTRKQLAQLQLPDQGMLFRRYMLSSKVRAAHPGPAEWVFWCRTQSSPVRSSTGPDCPSCTSATSSCLELWLVTLPLQIQEHWWGWLLCTEDGDRKGCSQNAGSGNNESYENFLEGGKCPFLLDPHKRWHLSQGCAR